MILECTSPATHYSKDGKCYGTAECGREVGPVSSGSMTGRKVEVTCRKCLKKM